MHVFRGSHFHCQKPLKTTVKKLKNHCHNNSVSPIVQHSWHVPKGKCKQGQTKSLKTTTTTTPNHTTLTHNATTKTSTWTNWTEHTQHKWQTMNYKQKNHTNRLTSFGHTAWLWRPWGTAVAVSLFLDDIRNHSRRARMFAIPSKTDKITHKNTHKNAQCIQKMSEMHKNHFLT